MSPAARYHRSALPFRFCRSSRRCRCSSRLAIAPFGVPLALLWLFACIPLASLCLAICWFGHDRDLPDEHIAADYDTGGEP